MSGAYPETVPLPFRRLCPHLRELLVATGPRGRRHVRHLMGMMPQGSAMHVGTRRARTAAGIMRLQLENRLQEGVRIFPALDFSKDAGYCNGEVHVTGMVLSATAGAALIGQPLSSVVGLPEAFPGRDAPILNVRVFSRSTRILIERGEVGMTLADFASTTPVLARAA